MLGKKIKGLLCACVAVCLMASITGCGMLVKPVITAIQEEIEESERPQTPAGPAGQKPEETPEAQKTPEVTPKPKPASEPKVTEEPKPEETKVPSEDSDVQEETSDGITLNIPEPKGEFVIPEYYRYDEAQFMEDCKAIVDAGNAGDSETIISLFEKLSKEIDLIDSLYTSAELRGNIDVTDSKWGEETQYCEELYYDCVDALYLAVKEAIAAGKMGDALEEYFGEDEYQEILEYEDTPDEIVEKNVKLTELSNKYHEEMSGCYDIPYTYKGKDYTLNNIIDGTIDMLAYTDYNGYLEVYTGIFKNINQVLGPIFVDMLKIRAELADYYEYDSFAAYAYEEDFGRDYSLDYADEYCEIIKQFVAPRFFDVYYSTDVPEISYSEDADKILEAMDLLTESLDPSINKGLKYMVDTKTYDIGSGSKRMEGCYTTMFPYEKEPFIFINTYNNGTGLSSLTHEFGHYLNFLVDANNEEEDLLSDVNYDIMETQANSLQLLCTNFYDQIYGEEAESMAASELIDSLYQVITGCIYDEFQREIYANPDMTLDEMNQLFARINTEYGNYEPGNEDYNWVLVTHTFESPMYYISYSVSSLGALNMWKNSQDDLEAAVEQYKKLLTYDKPGMGTVEYQEGCGLTLMTDEQGIKDICDEALAYITVALGGSNDDIWQMLEDLFKDENGNSIFDDFNLEDFGLDRIDWDSLRDMGFDFGMGEDPAETGMPNAA